MTGEKPSLPVGLKVAGSIFVLVHFFVIGMHVLADRSGPWPNPMNGPDSTVEAPLFAQRLSGPGFDAYLKPLHMPSRYHFSSNNLAYHHVKFDVKLYDEKGKLQQTLHFPDEAGNPWVRHRLDRLAGFLLADDVIPPQPEKAPATTEAPRYVPVWVLDKGIHKLQQKKFHEIRAYYTSPSEQAVLAAESYVRYLCRAHGAASGELIRRSKAAVQPSYLFILNELSPEVFQEMVASFGKINR